RRYGCRDANRRAGADTGAQGSYRTLNWIVENRIFGSRIQTPELFWSSAPAGGKVKERMKPQDIQDLKQLIEFLKQYQLAEFDLDRGDLKIRLKFHQQEGSSAGIGGLARPPPSGAPA